MPLRLVVAGSLVAGFGLGPLIDQIHVQTGALHYAHPDRLDQAWWVGPQFALAFVAIVLGARSIDAWLDADLAPDSTVRLLWHVAAFLAAYALTGFVHERPWHVVVVLAAALLLRLAPMARSGIDRALLVTMLLLAAGGSLYEGALASLPESFSYDVANIATIPAWLPLLYAHAAFMVVSVRRTLLT